MEGDLSCVPDPIDHKLDCAARVGMTYNDSYPKKPIGKGNPYQMCALCKKSDPEINGQITNHEPHCPWRKKQELKYNISSK